MEEIKSLLVQATHLGINKLNITGGEPLMREDIPQIVEAASAAGIRSIFLYTNGTLIDEGIATVLCRHSVHVQISLEGATVCSNDFIRGKGTFRQVLNAISILNRLRVPIQLSITVLRQNYNELTDFVKLAYNLGITNVRVGFPIRIGRCAENESNVYPTSAQILQAYIQLDEYLEAEKRNARSLPIVNQLVALRTCVSECCRRTACLQPLRVFVSSVGEVAPCDNLYEAGYIAGNIREMSLADLYENPQSFSFFRENNVDRLPSCRRCPFKYLCGGGCRGLAKIQTGDLYGVDPLCHVRKGLLLYHMFKVSDYPSSPRNLCASSFALRGGHDVS